MSQFLWSKAGAAKPDDEMMAFLAGEDVILDRELMAYDIRATMAHVAGLHRIGLFDDGEQQAIRECLQHLMTEYHAGHYVLDAPFEDSHSAIEAYVSQRLGDLGRKIHTGRSRNDQVLVATRLYLKDCLARLASVCAQLAASCLRRVERQGGMPMPGYTHLQHAVPSSVGLWMAAFAESFIDNAALSLAVRHHLDQNPLGTAAGYGVNLALDREGVTRDLGFARLQINPMYAQNSRGKFELLALQALGQATLDLRRLAWDLSLYTSSEFGFVLMPAAFRTGSSIMPNKSNPDLVELLRALHSSVLGAQIELDSVTALPSGYHRDLQSTKPPTLRVWPRALSGLRLAGRVIDAMEFDEQRMREAIDPDMYATDQALSLALSGVPFRDAYQQAAEALKQKPGNAEESLRQRVSAGACGALCHEGLQSRLVELKREIQVHMKRI